MNINKDFQLAVTCHRRGDLTQAEALYKKALKKQPNNIDILHMLGRICYQLLDYDEAIRYIKKEIEIAPSNAEAHFNLAFILHNTGRFDEAVLSYQKAIQIEPGLMEAYNNLGILLSGKGCPEEAIAHFQKAMQINPNYADIYNNLGLTLKVKGDIDEAITNYKKAIDLNPAFADAYYNLGVALQVKKQLDEAITSYKKAVQLNPDYASAYNNLGTLYHEKGQFDEAIDCYQKVLKFHPDFIDVYYNLSNVMRAKGDLHESLLYSKKVLELNPDHAETHYFNLSSIYLLTGNFEQGWKEYEWRLKAKDFIKREFSQPLWDGSDIAGKNILLYTEQGFGDAIQFIRYVPLVAERGARVILVCPKELKSLCKVVEGVSEVVTGGEQLPQFDLHCPLLSLPLKFNTTLDTIPAEIPYIKADTALLQKWKNKIEDDKSKFKAGLVWAGNPKFKGARIKACSLNTFSAFSQIEGITFYSLQKGDAAEQAKSPPEGMELIDYTDEIHDFSDTAALIMNLDLIISVDTAVAHLAGALGKPVWTLLPFVPDWRWMLKREDSPWYPTMRLFRQPSIGDWQPVIDKVAEELQLFIKEKVPEISAQDRSAHAYENRESSVNQATMINGGEMKKTTDDEDFYQTDADMLNQKETAAIILKCEGMGDCLFAIAVIKKINLLYGQNHTFVIFTHRPELFKKCPYVEAVYPIHDSNRMMQYQKRLVLFDTSQMPHFLVDTYDFISLPAGIGELSFREKQLEYCPVEEDRSVHYDVVINTSETWPSRSWPIENWQKVADFILAQGYSIAVVGKDTFSKADNMWKRSKGLKGCADLTNKLSLDQTYFTMKNCGLFITCQNGLSVLSGATDTEVIVLDMSIEWSKRAIYRNEDPHYKVTYVKGNCQLYCCRNFDCPTYGEFRCLPKVEQVLKVVKKKLKLIKKK